MKCIFEQFLSATTIPSVALVSAPRTMPSYRKRRLFLKRKTQKGNFVAPIARPTARPRAAQGEGDEAQQTVLYRPSMTQQRGTSTTSRAGPRQAAASHRGTERPLPGPATRGSRAQLDPGAEERPAAWPGLLPAVKHRRKAPGARLTL